MKQIVCYGCDKPFGPRKFFIRGAWYCSRDCSTWTTVIKIGNRADLLDTAKAIMDAHDETFRKLAAYDLETHDDEV